MDNRISIYSLGGLNVKQGGHLVTGFSSRKMEALLAYLAYTGRLHSREHLADLFWSDSPIETGLANLRVMLSRLRKIFPEHINSSRQSVGLNEGMAWSDAAELSQRLGEALAQWRSSSRILPAAVGRLEETMGLYSGAFLAGLSLREADGFDDWVSQERERIHALVLEASFALAELYQRQNSHESAKRLLQNALRIDPLEERAYRQLMQLYWEKGEVENALEVYAQLGKILEEELGTSPGKETEALLKRIQSGDAGRHIPQNIPLRLPQDSSIFVGRQRELAEITGRLKDEACRMLTILGLGGIGKTRLSVAAARILAADVDAFPDGIFFVALEDVPANLMVMSIGAVLGKVGYPMETLPQLKAFLGERKALLILDNFEHLLDQGEILSSLLEAAPNLKILITSRERLQLREEWLYDVHGLVCPESESIPVLEASEAVQMLHSTSKQLGIQLALGRDGRDIASLCRVVDGMPLALEMAASLIRDYGLEQLMQRIESSMDTLRSSLRNIPQRQLSLRLLFDSVWERLSTAEKQVLLRLSVFAGHISREAAIAVAGAKPRDLAALQSRLLLREAEMGRYSLHPLVRQYAFEKLAEEAEQLIQTQDNHAQYFGHFVSTRAEFINSHDFRPACDAIELEIENIRSAWLYSARTGRANRLAEMIHPLARYHIFMDRNEQGELLFAAVDGEKLPRALQGLIMTYRVWFKQNLRQWAQLEPLLMEALDLLRASHDREALCLALLRLVFHRYSAQHRSPEALEIVEEARQLAEELNHQEYLVNAYYLQGAILSGTGRLSEAASVIDTAISMNTRNPKLYAECNWLLGMNYFRREQMPAALQQFEKVLEFDMACKFESHYAHTLIIYGSVQMALLSFDDAEQTFRQSLAFYEEVKNVGAMSVCHERMGELCIRTERIEEAKAYYQLYRDWAESVGAWDAYIHCLSNMASTFESLGKTDPIAREAYQEALAVAERHKLPNGKARALRVGGWLELRFKEYDTALSLLRQAAALASEISNYSTMRLAIQGIFKYALQTNKPELAAWLKAAFLADPDTDDEILGEINAADLPEISFAKAPNLLELDEALDLYLGQVKTSH